MRYQASQSVLLRPGVGARTLGKVRDRELASIGLAVLRLQTAYVERGETGYECFAARVADALSELHNATLCSAQSLDVFLAKDREAAFLARKEG